MTKPRNPGLVTRISGGTGRLVNRVAASLHRAQLGPSRETDLRSFIPRR